MKDTSLMKCVITNFTFKVGNTDKMQLVSGTMSFISKFGVISPKVQKVSWLSSQTAHNFLQPNSFNLSMAFFVAFFRWQKGSCASSSSSCSSSRSHSGLRKKKVRPKKQFQTYGYLCSLSLSEWLFLFAYTLVILLAK